MTEPTTPEQAATIAKALDGLAHDPPQSFPTALQEQAAVLWQQAMTVAYSGTLVEIRALPELTTA